MRDAWFRKFVTALFFIIVAMVVVGLVIWAAVDGKADNERHSREQIENCREQGGTIVLGSSGRFKECYIGPVVIQR